MMDLISFLLEENVEGVTSSSNGIFAEPRLERPWEHLHVILFLLTTDLGKGLSLSLPQFCHLKKCSMIILILVRIQYRKYVMMHKSIKPHINLAIKIIPRNQTFHFHVSFKRNIRSLQILCFFFFQHNNARF